jgi:hypothetical protein
MLHPLPKDHELGQALRFSDMAYGQHWWKEAEGWDQFGIYDIVTEMTNLKKDGLHLDVGMGFGHLLARLAQKKEDAGIKADLLGIDRNPEIAESTMASLEGLKYAIHFCMRTLFEQKKGDTYLHRNRKYFYDAEKAAEKRFLTEDMEINVLGDDIRQGEALKEAIGTRKITSATYMFPGIGPQANWEYPYRVEMLDEAPARDRTIECMRSIRVAAYTLLTELCEADSQFILTERIPKYKGLDEEVANALSVRNTMTIMGTLSEHWDVGRSLITKGLDTGVQSSISWVSRGKKEVTDREELQKRGDGTGAFILELIRNDRPFKR